MSVSLILACLWVLVATAIALMPRRFHVPGAAVLTVAAIPLLGYVIPAASGFDSAGDSHFGERVIHSLRGREDHHGH